MMLFLWTTAVSYTHLMALAEPSDLMHPYLLLTLHGFLWHFMLIFIGLYCAMTGLGGRTPGDFVSMLRCV